MKVFRSESSIGTLVGKGNVTTVEQLLFPAIFNQSSTKVEIA